MLKQFFQKQFPIKNALFLFLFLSSFCTGLFSEAFCAVTSLVLTVLLCVEIFKSGKIHYSKSIEGLVLLLIAGGFLVTTLWATDRLFALIGFLKFFALVLFAVLLCSKSEQQREELLGFVPAAGVLMTVISAVMTYAQIAPEFFSVNNRIAGFFQYPNSFALFLLIGLIICALCGEFHPLKPVAMFILLGGIFLTGSRTCFVLLLASLIAILIVSKDKKTKLSLAILLGALLAAAAVYYFVSGKTDTLSRFFTISASSTTLKGRLIYAKDAAKEVLKHPFGLGYMGYYFTQGSFQSALYANMFVHNELLQMLLDIGWIPAIGFLFVIGRALFNKDKPFHHKLIIAAILLHSLFDFNLQFLIIDFIFIICLSDSTKVQSFTPKRGVQWAIAALLSLLFLLTAYFSVTVALFTLGKSDKAARLCPAYTLAQTDLLSHEEDTQKQVEIADTILKTNQHISIAFGAKAREQYALGDVLKMIEYEKKAIACARYSNNDYNLYYYMLLSATELYLKKEDTSSARSCIREITLFEKKLKEIEAATDPKAYELPEKPDFTIKPEYRQQYQQFKSLLAQNGQK
ncbi:MAG: O-antigen ligase family protein [Clostridia bacterium]|nr:O-antigen ligase family protein [Clostridia bacterium]